MLPFVGLEKIRKYVLDSRTRGSRFITWPPGLLSRNILYYADLFGMAAY
jgi:hypothetical protein